MQQQNALWIIVLAGWLHARDAPAQFGQNAPLPNNVPNNVRLLPRVGNPPVNSQQFYPFGYGSPLNNFQNFGGPSAFGGGGPYGNPGFNGFGGPYGAGYGNPWNGGMGNMGPWGGGYNGFGYGGFGNGSGYNGGVGYNGGFGYNGFGNGFGNMWGPGAPFGGYQFSGYGNYSPIVGWNNGWYPYDPGYNSPINQYMQQLFLQGLPNLNNMPNGNGKILSRAP